MIVNTEDVLRNGRYRELRGSLILVLTAMIWGSAFVAQDDAGARLPASFLISAARFTIGIAILIPVFFISSQKKNNGSPERRAELKRSVKAGLICGAALFAATICQQFGITGGTDSGKAGFITAMYCVLVPLGGVFLHKKISPLTWIAVTISPVGLYLLCIKPGGFSFIPSDLWVLASALLFTVQILAIDHFAGDCDGLLFSMTEFSVVAIVSWICALIFETGYIPQIGLVWHDILYLGIMSCGVAYTLQIFAQRDTNPAVASIIMSLEAVFALLFGALILSQIPTGRELAGCAVMLAAVILSQFPQPSHKRNNVRKAE